VDFGSKSFGVKNEMYMKAFIPAHTPGKYFWVVSVCLVLLLASFYNGKDWDLEKLNTAKDAAYLSELEKEVILEMNMVRSDPARYANEIIQPRLKYYDGKKYVVPGEVIRLNKEGKKAAEECIKALKKAKKAGLLYPSEGMSKAARDHATDQGKTGKIGHDGKDGSTSKIRIERYGQWDITIGENIDYGNETGREIVVSLLIDDGVSSRGHRKNILNSQYVITGVAYGTHPVYRTMCVIDYAGKYTDKR
jgi:uncharacterized protein YkwD